MGLDFMAYCFYLCYSFFIFIFYIYVMCTTQMQYGRFLLITKLDHIIKCKALIYSLFIQYFKVKWVEKEALNFINSL